MSRDNDLIARRFFEFESFRLDADKRVLLRSTGEIVPLAPKAFQTLLTLLEEAGDVVTKARLIAAVWPDTYVEENNLNQTVLALRRALGERLDGRAYIETVPRQGYRFVAPVNVTTGPVAPVAPMPATSGASQPTNASIGEPQGRPRGGTASNERFPPGRSRSARSPSCPSRTCRGMPRRTTSPTG